MAKQGMRFNQTENQLIGAIDANKVNMHAWRSKVGEDANGYGGRAHNHIKATAYLTYEDMKDKAAEARAEKSRLAAIEKLKYLQEKTTKGKALTIKQELFVNQNEHLIMTRKQKQKAKAKAKHQLSIQIK